MTRNISSYSLDEKRLNSTEPYSILLLRIEALRHTQPVLHCIRVPTEVIVPRVEPKVSVLS